MGRRVLILDDMKYRNELGKRLNWPVCFLSTALILIIFFNSVSAIDSRMLNDKIEPALYKIINETISEDNSDKVKTVSAASSGASSKIPVIVLLDKSQDPLAYSVSLKTKGISVPYIFHIINGVVAEASSKQIFDMAADFRTGKIYLDKEVNITDFLSRDAEYKISSSEAHDYSDEDMNESTIQIGAQELWKKGFKGQGVKVAVLDTGIDDSHPALNKNIVAKEDFTWWDGKLDPTDYAGHGTHVAGIIAGYWTRTVNIVETNVIFSGVAPEADLMNLKVLDAYGRGYDSSIIKGIEYAVDNNADIISMSLGGFGHADDLLSEVVGEAIKKGVSVIISAGNSGERGTFTIGSPGTSRDAITVGAVDKDDNIAWFSSIGPLETGEIKPDVAAPGVGIISACANTSYWLDCDYANEEYFISMSGTSMAAPHVAGAAALLLSAKKMNPAQLKALLQNGADHTSVVSDFIKEGAGSISLNDSYNLINDVIVSPFSLSFGVIRSEDTVDKSEDLTFYNLGGTPRTLNLEFGNEINEIIYPDQSNIVVPANGQYIVKLNISSSVNPDLETGFQAGLLNFKINDTASKSILVSQIVPKKLEMDRFGYWTSFHSSVFNSSDPLDNWYETRIIDGTYYLDAQLDGYGDFSLWIMDYSFFSVINPALEIVFKDFIWPDYYDEEFFWTDFEQYEPENGTWLFFAKDDLFEELNIAVSHPSYLIESDYRNNYGTPGDTVTNVVSVKNVLDMPMRFNVTGSIQKYAAGEKKTEANFSMENPYGFLYIKQNITDIAEGFVIKLKRADNYSDCQEFEMHIFDPSGEELTERWVDLCNYRKRYYFDSPVFAYEKYEEDYATIDIKNEMEGVWSFILVPIVYDWYGEEYVHPVSVKSEIYDMVPAESLTSIGLGSITLNSGEEKNLTFETKIPDNFAQFWHYEIFGVDVSLDNCPLEYCEDSDHLFVSTDIRQYYLDLDISRNSSRNSKYNFDYYSVASGENLSFNLSARGINSFKETDANLTFIRILDFYNYTYFDRYGNAFSYLEAITDPNPASAINIGPYHVNGTINATYTIPSSMERGYWYVFAQENKTGSTAEPPILFIKSNSVKLTLINETNFDATEVADTNLTIKVKSETESTISVNRYYLNPVSVNLPGSVKFIEILADNLESLDSATIDIKYNSSEIQGLSESSLKIYYYNESSRTWQQVSSQINTQGKYVTATVTHFSLYAIAGSSSITSALCGDGVCNGGESCSSCSYDCGSCSSSSSSSSSSSRRSSSSSSSTTSRDFIPAASLNTNEDLSAGDSDETIVISKNKITGAAIGGGKIIVAGIFFVLIIMILSLTVLLIRIKNKNNRYNL